MEYCLLDIGVRKEKRNDVDIPVTDATSNTNDTPAASVSFKYERQTYTQLDTRLQLRTIIRDVRRVPEYELRERTDACDSSTIILGVFLRMMRPMEEYDHGCVTNRQRLIDVLFEKSERCCFVEQELDKKSPTAEDDAQVLSVPQFYEQLRFHHQVQTEKTQPATLPETNSHPFLRPQLRPYQQQAIRWMVNRETNPASLPAQFQRLRSTTVPEVDFFMDLYTLAISDGEPQPTPLPAGGILADEMGMGKTVEILGLLLQNRRLAAENKPLSDGNEPMPSDGDEEEDASAEIRCLCVKTNRRNTIACRKCRRLQHLKCVVKHMPAEKTGQTRYLCPECWRTEPLVESRATIIVSPASIKHQWHSEIQKHVADPNFRVFIYDGVNGSGWISPADLATYDVVLTDYNVLRPEIYLVAENARTSRHEKRFLSPVTPLTMVRWWRVCLDEAQMVECVGANATKMVKALPAVHRWTVTGTPIEKTINNLFGLVHYLDYAPYNNFPVWHQYVSRFQGGNPEPLLRAMVRVMWRTCKHAVLDQLGIPPQTERVHYIAMSDLQSYFYRNEHIACAQAFREKAQKLRRDLSMAQMNVQTLNVLLEPLRKLRLDCTIPSVLHLSRALPAKKLLTPSELHEHLVTVNINDCKSQLRSVVSSLNGLAAVNILQRNYDQACALYRASLRWADDYQGAISVDTLLQIHALHNLLDLSCSFRTELDPGRQLTETEMKEYEERCARLEWRYIENYADKVRAIELTLQPATEKVAEFIALSKERPLLRSDGSSWRALFTIFESNSRHGNLLVRLFREQNSLGSTGVCSWRTMDLWLMNWLDKVLERRRALQEGFHSLDFFTENLKPNHMVAGETRAKIEQLVRSAFACHLDPALFEVDQNGMRTDERLDDGHSKAPVCLLCTVQNTLNNLEAVLFLKKQTQVATGGLWQISLQEQVLKHIQQYAKRQETLDELIVSEGEQWLTYLERVKLEFKEFSQYWVEINYTVAAYDELTMCKSRLQLLTIPEYRSLQEAKKKPTLMQLLECELPMTIAELQQTKIDAERAFIRLKGTLKYLDHLGARKDIDSCPICQTIPEGRYAVLQCGHHICSVCEVRLLKFAKASGNRTSCVICRHEQHVKEIQYVTLTYSTVQTVVRGSYSSKLVKIVETILELKQLEADVKIVIFSQWEPILSEIGVALRENHVTFREKSAKFYRSVQEFKDYAQGVTCLLLPLCSGSKGLNLTEATHVFLVEPILNPGEELQAIGRVHRIGQTRPTYVHRFIVQDTIEETIHETIQKDRSGRWLANDITVDHLEQLFGLRDAQEEELIVL